MLTPAATPAVLLLLLLLPQASAMAHTTLLAALLLLVACTLAPAQGGNCPGPYFLMGSRCIYINVDIYAMQSDWEYARTICAQKANSSAWTADLVANYDAAFQRLLTIYIKAHSPDLGTGHVYYVGAELVAGRWQWVDGTPIADTDYIWGISSPSQPPPSSSIRPEWMKGVLSLSHENPHGRMYLGTYPSTSFATSALHVCEARPEA